METLEFTNLEIAGIGIVWLAATVILTYMARNYKTHQLVVLLLSLLLSPVIALIVMLFNGKKEY